MATRFEFVLHGENPVALRAAGEEALAEIERLEAQLSLFRPGSEIAHLNAVAAQGPVRVTPGLFALLRHAQQLHAESGGAFDITIAPLMRCWGFLGGSGHMPQAEEVAEARAKVGMHLVQLREEDFTVQFARSGVMLDLGAIGKGYAIERAVDVLRDAGVSSALLHGGTSTVYALGHPPEGDAWKVAIESPRPEMRSYTLSGSSHSLPLTESGEPGLGGAGPRSEEDGRDARSTLLTIVPLKDEAMSVSAIWGKFFQVEGKTFGHILDPRTGKPAHAAVLAAIVLPSATETDALSTALLTRGVEGHEPIARLRPGARTLLVVETGGQFHVEAKGIIVGAMP
jgi:FAD:protein FMN transferase